MDHRSYTEIGVATFIIVICAIFLLQAIRLPPGSFEPLGSGPIPIYTSAIIIFCCVLVIVRSVTVLLRSSSLSQEFKLEFSGESPIGAILMLGMSIFYVSLLQLQIASFGIITFAFLTLLIWSMERFRRHKLIPAFIISALFSFGAEYVFTNIFVVDLPT